MKRALTAAEARAVEERAAARYGLSVPVLMENAGAAVAEAALKLADPLGRFLVLCGGGNNGGDGLVAARKLALAGRQVHVEQIGDPARRSAEAVRVAAALKTTTLDPAPIDAGFAVRVGDVVIDAIFGTGLSRAPSGHAAEAIARIAGWRAAGARVVSADLPSGLPSDGAPPHHPCVEADVTVALGALKLGHLTSAGAAVCGRIEVASLGFPPVDDWPVEGPGVSLLPEEAARRSLNRRPLESNKGSFGHVLVVGGGFGKSGAAALCGLAVLRAGAGLCTVAARPEPLAAAQASAAELMGYALPPGGPQDEALGPSDAPALRDALAQKRAWVVGPGLPRGPKTGALLLRLLEETAIPTVIDADALNALADHVDALAQGAGPRVLTPHPGEMARLMKTEVATVQADRLGAARSIAARTRSVVVLKGARTVIAAPDGKVFVNPSGNPALATGGTGDVLAGVCGALLAQGLPPLEAACTAVYAHGLAAELASSRTGLLGLLASDLLPALGEVWRRWER